MGAIHFSIDIHLIHALRRKLSLRAFVETGTFRGDTAAATAPLFERVYTIELSQILHEAAARRLAALGNVTALFGDSPRLLAELRPRLAHQGVLYWLDAHWCGESTAGAQAECPVLAELAAIASLDDDCVVLIDDARLFMAPPPAPHDAAQWPRLDELIDRLRSLNARHAVWILDDVIVFAPIALQPELTEHSRTRGVDLHRLYQTAHSAAVAEPPRSTPAKPDAADEPPRALKHRFNAELLSQPRSERIFAHHLLELGIERVLDIGANTGQFAAKLRASGYNGIIYSVEPQAGAYAELLRNAAADLRWFPLARQGAGAAEGFVDLNLAENGWSSSLLEVHANHVRAERTTRIVGTERIHVAPSGDLLRRDLMADIEALKIDVQGYEDRVLDGYASHLQEVRLLLLEMSMVECYRGAPDLFALDSRLVDRHGFTRVSLEPAYYDDTRGVVQQYDGIYYRPDKPARRRAIVGASISQVVTSIGGSLDRTAGDGTPLGAAWFDLCLGSWRNLSGDVLSVAESPPPSPAVHWLRSGERPSVVALLKAASAGRGTHVVLTNSDIAFGDELVRLVPSLDPSAAYYGHRFDVTLPSGDLAALQLRAPYEWGFDFFLLPAQCLGSLTSELLPEHFRLGEPWWDYLLPLALLAHGFPVKKMPMGVAWVAHLEHPTRYAHDLWLERGAQFLEHAERLRAASPCHAAGLLEEISMQRGELEPRLRRAAEIVCRGLP